MMTMMTFVLQKKLRNGRKTVQETWLENRQELAKLLTFARNRATSKRNILREDKTRHIILKERCDDREDSENRQEFLKARK